MASYAQGDGKLSATASDAAPVLLFTVNPNRQRWRELLHRAGVPAAFPEDIADMARVRFAIIWQPPPGLLQQCPQLQVVASLGAGIDHLMGAGQVPESATILRIVDPLMAQRMATYVFWGVVHWQRKMDEYWRAQQDSRWDKGIENFDSVDNGDVAVGVLGYGVMGRASAELLHHAGYRTLAWARSPKTTADERQQQQAAAAAASDAAAPSAGGTDASETPAASGSPAVDGIPAAGGMTAGETADGTDSSGAPAGGTQVFYSRSNLQDFVGRCNVLVCLLPLTADTKGLINAEVLSWLPRGAAVINVARGGHVVEADLLAALDAGQLSHALLDVVSEEPLPPSSPLWSHPGVRITPHVSCNTQLQNAVDQIRGNYQRFLDGRPLLNMADRRAGY